MNKSFLKYALIAVISLALGGLAGAYLSHFQVMPTIVELTARAGSLQREKDKLVEEVERLMRENRVLKATQADLQAAIYELEQRPEQAQQPVENQDLARDLMQAFEAIQDDAPESQGPTSQTGERDDSRDEFSRWTPEERAARFREFEQRVRERVNGVLQQEYAQAPDRATQDRIELLQAYMDQMAQLRGAMRDAETDQDREILRQSMRESYTNIRDLVQTQQDSMLRSFAAENGIKDSVKQDAFIANLRDLQRTPFFQAERMMGGGFGGWGGGPGSWGGRGPRRR